MELHETYTQLRNIKEVAIHRLLRKGMEASLIPAFLRNLKNILASQPNLEHTKISSLLGALGWEDIDLDDHTLQLLIAACDFENTGDFTQKSEVCGLTMRRTV